MSREQSRYGAKLWLFRVSWIGIVLSGMLLPVLSWAQALSVTPSLTLGVRYDDNVFQTKTQKQDDFIGVISPSIEVLYVPRRDTELTFQYSPSFDVFFDNSSENNVSHRLRLGFESPRARRLSATVSDQLQITDEAPNREVDLDTGTRSSSDQGRQRTTRNVAEARVRYRLAPRTSVGGLFRNLIEDVSDGSEADEFSYTFGGDVGYLTNVARGNRVAVSYTITYFTFKLNKLSQTEINNGESQPQVDDFNVHTAAVGYEHRFSPTLTGTASLGYSFTRSNDLNDGTDSGIVGRIGLSKLLRTGSASINYERAFTSGGGAGGEVIADRVVVQLTAGLTAKIAATLGASVAVLDYQASSDQNDDRKFYTIRPGLTYQVLRSLQLSGLYEFSQTLFDRSIRADRADHRVKIGSRLTLRKGLSVALGYEYFTRRFSSTGFRDDNEFSRNLVTLSVTYGPTLRY